VGAVVVVVVVDLVSGAGAGVSVVVVVLDVVVDGGGDEGDAGAMLVVLCEQPTRAAKIRATRLVVFIMG
jgi:hypothetical protein